MVDHGGKGAVGAYPLVDWVAGTGLLQFARGTIPDVVADVLLVDQHLVHNTPCPRALPVGTKSTPIQQLRNVGFAAAFFDESLVDALDHLLFGFRPRRENHTIRLKALVLTTTQQRFRLSSLINQLTPQPISRWSTLSVAQLDQVRLPRKHLDGQLAAVLPRHHALNAFDDAGNG
ncbi:hypothetical protein FQZ97_892650 [compost metagenome]